MSLGINTIQKLVAEAAKVLAPAGFDVEIVEKHHNQKLDVPSGTAILLADSIKSVKEDCEYNIGRHESGKRKKNEIGIHAIRMGNIVGEHEVIIGTDTQTITLKHEAHTRALFAEGAIAAADFLVGKPAGLYAMKDIVK